MRLAPAAIVVTVEADLRFGPQTAADEPDASGDVLGQHVAGRVGHVHAVGAVGFQELGLCRDRLRRRHVTHHQESDGVEAELARDREVLLGDVGFGAVGGDADHSRSRIHRDPQIVDRADARNEQHGDPRALHPRNHGSQVFLVRMPGKTIVDRAAAEAVPVRHFDQRNPRLVEARRDRHHLVDRQLVRLRVHAVAQAHVVERDALAPRAHDAAPRPELASRCFASAQISAVRVAAAVMMSRFPAYSGRKSPRPLISRKIDTRRPSNTTSFFNR
jgi:hypothetical protein